MATYDETVGSAAIPWDKLADGGFFRLEHTLNAATAIARHATPTSDGYFTANDILQLIDFPAGCVFLYSIFRTVTAGTTGGAQGDLGLAGGTEFDTAVALDATAGTVVVGSVADGSADDAYAAADTADMQAITQNLLTGEWVWSIVGIYGA